jgi:hypothetical protein
VCRKSPGAQIPERRAGNSVSSLSQRPQSRSG